MNAGAEKHWSFLTMHERQQKAEVIESTCEMEEIEPISLWAGLIITKVVHQVEHTTDRAVDIQ